jgi:ribosomal protein L11 methyltransferase
MKAMSWIQIAVEVGSEQVAMVSGLFELAGALSVTCQDAAAEALLEPAPGDAPLWKRTRVAALFDAEIDVDRVMRGVCGDSGIDAACIVVETLGDRDWSTSWRDGLRPLCFGERLWVCPTDIDCPQDDAIVLRLDPGNAFGTGTHATTAMCLEWLDRHPPRGLTVIDYGCGSGILAIAAAKLGATSVHAVDIDAQAITASRDNARLNDIHSGFDVQLPTNFVAPPADLVIANILANPLQELAGDLAGMLRPGGAILLTGVLVEQSDAVMKAYRQWIDFGAPVRRDEWVLLEGTKISSR